MPAIVVGIILARKNDSNLAWGKVAHEAFLGKSIVLLVGGLLIGWISGPVGLAPLEPLFFDLFKGVLALFLLEMGLIAAAQARTVLKNGLFLIGFGILAPLPLATVGALLGAAIGLSVGGTTMLAVLAGSASYIAAPAAMRIAVPEANPSLSLTSKLWFEAGRHAEAITLLESAMSHAFALSGYVVNHAAAFEIDGAGLLAVGGVTSLIVIVWITLIELPQSSVTL